MLEELLFTTINCLSYFNLAKIHIFFFASQDYSDNWLDYFFCLFQCWYDEMLFFLFAYFVLLLLSDFFLLSAGFDKHCHHYKNQIQ